MGARSSLVEPCYASQDTSCGRNLFPQFGLVTPLCRGNGANILGGASSRWAQGTMSLRSKVAAAGLAWPPVAQLRAGFGEFVWAWGFVQNSAIPPEVLVSIWYTRKCRKGAFERDAMSGQSTHPALYNMKTPHKNNLEYHMLLIEFIQQSWQLVVLVRSNCCTLEPRGAKGGAAFMEHELGVVLRAWNQFPQV